MTRSPRLTTAARCGAVIAWRLSISAMLSLTVQAAMAQAYPSKPIRMIVPYTAGGSTDAVARALAQGLSQRLKTQVVVENKPGGNTIIATQYVASAAPDGYTLYMTNTAPYSMLPAMYKKLPYDAEKDYTAVAFVGNLQLGLFTTRQSGITDFANFVNAARSRPGKVVYGNTGIGQIPAIAFEMIKAQLKIDVLGVPFSGSPPMIQSLLAGDSHAAINDLGTMMPLVKSGNLVPIAVLGSSRLPALPQVPTLRETGYPIDVPVLWQGVTGPAGMPAAVVAILNKAINEEVQGPELRAVLEARYLVPRTGTPAELDAAMQQDFKAWGPAVRRLGISLD
jgi:tripartite-type tricarboxylate transporter receptor subunit TctC